VGILRGGGERVQERIQTQRYGIDRKWNLKNEKRPFLEILSMESTNVYCMF
jgi:hypothetical protein